MPPLNVCLFSTHAVASDCGPNATNLTSKTSNATTLPRRRPNTGDRIGLPQSRLPRRFSETPATCPHLHARFHFSPCHTGGFAIFPGTISNDTLFGFADKICNDMHPLIVGALFFCIALWRRVRRVTSCRCIRSAGKRYGEAVASGWRGGGVPSLCRFVRVGCPVHDALRCRGSGSGDAAPACRHDGAVFHNQALWQSTCLRSAQLRSITPWHCASSLPVNASGCSPVGQRPHRPGYDC